MRTVLDKVKKRWKVANLGSASGEWLHDFMSQSSQGLVIDLGQVKQHVSMSRALGLIEDL